jgi:hypothetical protein
VVADPKLDIVKEMHRIMEEARADADVQDNCAEQIPRYGDNGELLPTAETPECGCNGFIFDPLADDQKGIRPKPADMNFGETLKVNYERCGGSLRFRPVYFTKGFRTSYLTHGQGTECEEPEEGEEEEQGCSGKIINAQSKENSFLVPVHYMKQQIGYDFASVFAELDAGEDKPFYAAAFQLEKCNRGYRRPGEFWGWFLYQIEDADGENVTKFKNDNGLLSAQTVQQPFIREISVNRSLDGQSGSFKWDRFGAGVNRPEQEVGAIRFAVNGGENTAPGVIFTGIGMGNAEQDNHDTNTVDIPLHGYDVKMTDSGGGLRLVNAPFFDGMDHRCVIEWLACYAGIEVEIHATPYKLPTGLLSAPAVDFKTGTPVWDAIAEIQKLAGTLAYFDRFGVLQYRDVGQTTGVNHDLPESAVISYDDKPDLTSMRNVVVIAALVTNNNIEVDPNKFLQNLVNENELARPALVTRRLKTTPEFPWDKMMFYVVPGIIKQGDLNRIAAKISEGVSRPRAAGNVTIPGNANIELLDTVNTIGLVVGISHSCNTQSKEWSTTLNLELLAQGDDGGDDNCGGQGDPNQPVQDGPPVDFVTSEGEVTTYNFDGG